MNSNFHKKVSLLTQTILVCLLLCVWFSGITLQSSFAENSDELVYCPLQKDWVKRNEKRVIQQNPLDEICADNEKKDSFLVSFFSKANLQIDVSDLFFDYNNKGEIVFVEFIYSPQFPNHEIAVVGISQKVSRVYKNEFVKKQGTISIELNSPRPPNHLITTKFAYPKFQKQLKISHQTFARPPPVEIS